MEWKKASMDGLADQRPLFVCEEGGEMCVFFSMCVCIV